MYEIIILYLQTQYNIKSVREKYIMEYYIE